MDHQEVEQKTEEAATENSQPQEEGASGPDLNISDLAALKNVVEVATQRGAFKANELEAVGKIFNKLDAFLNAVSNKEE